MNISKETFLKCQVYIFDVAHGSWLQFTIRQFAIRGGGGDSRDRIRDTIDDAFSGGFCRMVNYGALQNLTFAQLSGKRLERRCWEKKLKFRSRSNTGPSLKSYARATHISASYISILRHIPLQSELNYCASVNEA